MANDNGWIGEGPTNRVSEEDLRQWAADKNRFAERIGADWWYSVQRIDQADGGKLWQVVKQEGFAAIISRLKARGERHERWKPTPEEAHAIHKKIASYIADGMTQGEFNERIRRGLEG